MNEQRRGFTLLETIVAFVVLAIGLTTVGMSFGLAARTDMQLQAQRTALTLVRSRLESAGITEGLAVGQRAGWEGELRWTETVSLVRVTPELAARRAPTAARPTAPPAVQGFWVEVTVEGTGGHVARLAVLQLPGADQP